MEDGGLGVLQEELGLQAQCSLRPCSLQTRSCSRTRPSSRKSRASSCSDCTSSREQGTAVQHAGAGAEGWCANRGPPRSCWGCTAPPRCWTGGATDTVKMMAAKKNSTWFCVRNQEPRKVWVQSSPPMRGSGREAWGRGGDGADVSRAGAWVTVEAQTGVHNSQGVPGVLREGTEEQDKARQLSPGLGSRPDSFLLPELGGNWSHQDSLPTEHHPEAQEPTFPSDGRAARMEGQPAQGPGLGPATSRAPHLRPVAGPAESCSLPHPSGST